MSPLWIALTAVCVVIGLIIFMAIVLRQYHLSVSHQTKLLDFMER